MKRLRTILLFLLLGAVVNVAVAWGFALWSEVQPLRGAVAKQTTLSRARVDPDMRRTGRRAGFGLEITHASGGLVMETGTSGSAKIYEAGIPWRSMTGWRGALTERQVFIRPPDWMRPIQSMFERRFLPPRPLWLGFAGNTVVYGLVLWAPFAPFALRRIIRRHRGLCVRCGYDLRGGEHERCPECGAEAPRGSS